MSKQVYRWIGWIVLIVVLVAGSFVGGQLLNRRVNALDRGGGALAGESFQPREIHVIPAEELPSTPPDEAGVFVRRQDNSIFIGIGDSTGNSEPPVAGESSAYSGAVVEVVVGNQTTIYREVLDLSQSFTSDEIQQEVTEGTIEEIGDTSHMFVWGRKVGDRIIADVLVYSLPMVKPALRP
jgi:hypothetical protein